jgi:hypothetical protein
MTSIYPNINQRTFIKALELFHKRDKYLKKDNTTIHENGTVSPSL